jgi:hypothetical protein
MGDTDEETYNLIQNKVYDFDDEIWDTLSAEVKQLIEDTFLPENERITPKQILRHPWVKKYAEEEAECEEILGHMNRIRKFQSHCKFRKTILSYIAAFVNDDDIKKEIALFNQIDRDKDGYITKKEFKKANKKFKLGFDVDAVFKALDMDKNEAINFNEFIAAIMDEKAAK